MKLKSLLREFIQMNWFSILFFFAVDIYNYLLMEILFTQEL